jgi:hypothetical protein
LKIALINPPYQTITSNVGVGHQVPLGLLMVGGPLIDAGHDVRLIDGECGRLSIGQIVGEVRRLGAEVVMTGHAGSTPAHPVCTALLRAMRAELPGVKTVYGGRLSDVSRPRDSDARAGNRFCRPRRRRSGGGRADQGTARRKAGRFGCRRFGAGRWRDRRGAR